MRFEETGRHGRLTVISALGVVEILAWGSSFYLLGVFVAPIAADTGWQLAWVFGGLTIGLLVAGVVSPRVGRIGERGGRPVLAFSALALATGLVVLGLAPSLPVFVAGWGLLGLGMGCGLYDPTFATLGRLYGAKARPAITTLTLSGGFASTVSWPLSAFLLEHGGWRDACFVYAGLQLVVSLPLILLLIPPAPARPAGGSASPASAVELAPAGAPAIPAVGRRADPRRGGHEPALRPCADAAASAWRAARLGGDVRGAEPICRVLPIASSTYHTHAARRADPGRLAARARSDAALMVEIQRVSEENFCVYGVRKSLPRT